MSNKKVVIVTGSSGRIGTRLLDRLSHQYQKVAMDYVGRTQSDSQVEFIFVDLGSDHSVKCAFDRVKEAYGNKIASIVHLAAFYSFSGKDLHLYEKITVQGTRRLMDEAKKCDVEQFIFTSTMLVHEPSKRGVIQNENSPIKGKWHYPASKVRTEHLLHDIHGSIPTVMLRIGGCYDEQCNCVPISQHIARIFEKQMASFLFPGDNQHGVPYTHFDDLIDMIVMLIEKRATLPKESTFLCVEEDSITYRDLQTIIGRELHGTKKWPMIRVPKWFAKIGAFVLDSIPFGPPAFIKPWMVDLADDNYEFSMEHAKKVLGFKPKHRLRDTLPIMIANMKKDPLGWYKQHQIPAPCKVKKMSGKCCGGKCSKKKKK
jgi:UDP-glucose 4-epimerase